MSTSAHLLLALLHIKAALPRQSAICFFFAHFSSFSSLYIGWRLPPLTIHSMRCVQLRCYVVDVGQPILVLSLCTLSLPLLLCQQWHKTKITTAIIDTRIHLQKKVPFLYRFLFLSWYPHPTDAILCLVVMYFFFSIHQHPLLLISKHSKENTN